MWPGNEWLLTPYRALVHRPTATAVVADLHLGYMESRRMSGEAVPPFGWTAIQDRLSILVHRFQLERLVIAGDLTERGRDGRSAAARLVTWANALGVRIGLVPGNHDMGLGTLPDLEVYPSPHPIGDWGVVHDAATSVRGRLIQGHIHPVLRCRGVSGQAPCYLVTRNRVVLPAQSDDAAGVNVLSLAAWANANCHAIVGDEVLDLGPVRKLRKELGVRPRVHRPA